MSYYSYFEEEFFLYYEYREKVEQKIAEVCQKLNIKRPKEIIFGERGLLILTPEDMLPGCNIKCNKNGEIKLTTKDAIRTNSFFYRAVSALDIKRFWVEEYKFDKREIKEIIYYKRCLRAKTKFRVVTPAKLIRLNDLEYYTLLEKEEEKE